MLRTPLFWTSGRSCHKLNLELEFLSKLICGGALFSTVLVGSASDGVSSLGEVSSGSVCESCSRLVSISSRVDLSRYSWYKSPRKEHNRSERLQLNERVEKYLGKSNCFALVHLSRGKRYPFHAEWKANYGIPISARSGNYKWKTISKSKVLLTICSHKTFSNTVRWIHDHSEDIKEAICQASKCFLNLDFLCYITMLQVI